MTGRRAGDVFETDGGNRRVVNPDWPEGDGPYCEPADGEDPTGERCVFCDEARAAHDFEDGLRCVYCAREQDEPEGEAPAVPSLEEMAEEIEGQRGRLAAARARRDQLREPYEAAASECRELARRLAAMQRAMAGSKRAYEIRRALDAAGLDYRDEPVIPVKVYEGHRLFLLAAVGSGGTGLYVCKPDKSGRYSGKEHAVLLKQALAQGYDPQEPKPHWRESTKRNLSDAGLLAWAERGSGNMGDHTGAFRPRQPPEGGRWRWLKIVEQEALTAPGA